MIRISISVPVVHRQQQQQQQQQIITEITNDNKESNCAIRNDDGIIYRQKAGG